MDFSAGTYHARRLPPRARYSRAAFLEYLNNMDGFDVDDLDPLEMELAALEHEANWAGFYLEPLPAEMMPEEETG